MTCKIKAVFQLLPVVGIFHSESLYGLWLVAWHSGRTLVFDWRTFRSVLDLQLTGDHLCG